MQVHTIARFKSVSTCVCNTATRSSKCLSGEVVKRDHVFLVRPFRRHLFPGRSFSTQIVSAPIRCSLTVQLFRVRVRVRVWVSKKARNIGAEKVRAEMVAKSCTLKRLRTTALTYQWPEGLGVCC